MKARNVAKILIKTFITKCKFNNYESKKLSRIKTTIMKLTFI